jgi:outer membrane protein assembly factor BamD
MKKLLLLAVIVIMSCTQNNLKMSEMTSEQKYKIAQNLFEKGKFNKSIPYFENIVLERNSLVAANAQMKLADAYFNLKKYDDALYEYKEFIRLFPEDKNYQKAYLRIGICYFKQSLNPNYTQEETKQALQYFQNYLEKFPFHKNKSMAIEYIKKCQLKLLEKKFLNGYIYYKTYDYSSALMYFNEVIKLNNTNKTDKKCLYYSALIYLYRHDFTNSRDVLSKLKGKYKTSKETKEISKKFKQTFENE